jgi:hypothetical protein
MSKIRCLVSSALLVLAGLSAARAEEKVLMPGNPALTQRMVDDYYRLAQWRWRPSARDLEALQRARLQQWNDARQLELRALSNLQASNHETQMFIINNILPSGHVEYNPSTGRYDRYVPNPSRR